MRQAMQLGAQFAAQILYDNQNKRTKKVKPYHFRKAGFKMKRHLTDGEIKNLFEDNAKKGAQDVCGNGPCISCFKCGHQNSTARPLRAIGKGEKCPLEAYNVTPDMRSFAEKLMDGMHALTPDEQNEQLFAVCACCEHTGVIENDEGYELDRSEQAYRDYCVDCPINKAREAIAEAMAEAMMS